MRSRAGVGCLSPIRRHCETQGRRAASWSCRMSKPNPLALRAIGGSPVRSAFLRRMFKPYPLALRGGLA